MTIGPCGQTWWTATEAAACVGGTLSPLTLATCLELARFLEVARFLEMPPASVAPVAARLEKMRIPKILPGVITSLQQAGPIWGHPRTDNAVGTKVVSAQRGPAGF